jgi:2-polyprenyl-6-methoxyphenol hydroxylase-like FAD-dependent oxidoreductase
MSMASTCENNVSKFICFIDILDHSPANGKQGLAAAGAVPCTVVTGDAAHATSPQLDQGTNLALLDAVALTQALSTATDLPSARAAYTQARRGHLHFYSQASRLLTPLFQSDLTLLPWLRDIFLAHSAGWPVMQGLSLQTLVGVRKGWLGGQLAL